MFSSFSTDGDATFTPLNLPESATVMTTGAQGFVSVFGFVLIEGVGVIHEPGDLDGDGDVDQDDLGIVVSCFGQFVADNPDCAIADVAPPPDGVVNILDVSFVVSNFTP